MADVTRSAELVQTIERDEAFRTEIEAAPTAAAKRAVLDTRGFQDVGLDDMRAYVERNGGTLVLRQGDHELSEQELAAIAGGMTESETIFLAVGAGGGAMVGASVALAAAAA